MRPSTFRPSVLTTEGLALLDKERLSAKYAGHSRDAETFMAKAQTRTYAPTVQARIAGGTVINVFLQVDAIEGSRADLHAAILRRLAAMKAKLHAVIEYGDEARGARCSA